jgi:hypothetical protein
MVKSQRFYLVIAAGEFEKRMEGELGEAAAAIGGGGGTHRPAVVSRRCDSEPVAKCRVPAWIST